MPKTGDFDRVCSPRSKTIDYKTFVKYLEELAAYKKLDANDIKGKMSGCGMPGTSGATVSAEGPGGGHDPGSAGPRSSSRTARPAYRRRRRWAAWSA